MRHHRRSLFLSWPGSLLQFYAIPLPKNECVAQKIQKGLQDGESLQAFK